MLTEVSFLSTMFPFFYLCRHMKLNKYILSTSLLLTSSLAAFAQTQKTLDYTIETGATVGIGNHTPFWLVANRYGKSSIRKNNAYLDAGIFKRMEEDKDFSYALGLELVGASRFTSKFFVQQAYADVRYRWAELSVGSKERGNEILNDRLSSGGLTFSTNARPIPQARLSIPEYTPFPWTHGWLHVKGHIAFGKFTDDGFQEDFTNKRSKFTNGALYHSKAGFLKIENEKSPVSVELGLEMAAQMGGTCYYPQGNGTFKELKTPVSWKDFFKILLPSSGGTTASESDQINILGNHLGSYTAALSYRFRTWKAKAYYQHSFEDRSGMGFTYGPWKDFLAGLEVTLPANRFVSTVVGEMIYTKHQSGAFHTLSESKEPFTGADNYYNNGQYAGWEHWGQGIGNPLLISPIYNTDGNLSFKSNRVKGFHIGLTGQPIAELEYRLLFSGVSHWGTYGLPFRDIKHSYNGMLEMTYRPMKLKGWSFTLSGAADAGSMLGRSGGGMLTVRKIGLIGRKK